MFSFIKKQFIDIIQWENPDDETLVWRFPIADQEIQNGASLTVRESQMALFVDEGKTADVFSAGMYKLNTQTLPVLTYLKNWDKLFESPFKSDVYFFNVKQQLARKWGTAQPVTVRDPEFGAVQLRSFGMYSYRISDPETFFKQVSGVVESYTGHQLEQQLRNIAVTQLAAVFGNSGTPFLDMAANQILLSQKLAENLAPEFARLGLTLENATVESISLPDNIQQALDKKISMGIVGNLDTYTKFQTAEAIPLAAQNEGGVAGIGAGLGVGAGIGQAMAGAMAGMMQPNAQPAAGEAAAPVQTATEDPQAKLQKLKALLDGGLISAEDFEKAKAEVLKQLIG
ncbi:SPFH domain-containing protein [Neisseria sp. WLZKY-1]|uniref:SPFH domain-containing protein n=1 Tax=Neisseria sp. WLZKY-1 TaxID=3390377 RepID=UPI00397A3AFE